MNQALEERIVRNFIAKRYRKRSLFELFGKDERKRDHFVWMMRWRFDETCVHEISKSIATHEDVLQRMRAIGASGNCYIMKTGKGQSGIVDDLSDGLEQVVFAWPAFLVCNDGNIGYFDGDNYKALLYKEK